MRNNISTHEKTYCDLPPVTIQNDRVHLVLRGESGIALIPTFYFLQFSCTFRTFAAQRREKVHFAAKQLMDWPSAGRLVAAPVCGST